MKFIVLGGYGNIGQVIVKDLFRFSEGEITVAGHREDEARKFAKSFKSRRVTAAKAEVRDTDALAQLLCRYDVCINATQYYHNLEVMQACLEAKVHYLDLGGLYHMTKKQLHLDRKFRRVEKTAILGCGSTPGITNVLAGYGASFFDTLKSVDISFADADFTVYHQKFVLPYSFYTLVDEFTLPAMVYRDKHMHEVQPMSGEKVLFFKEFPKSMQKKKGFYTLHSELATFPSSFRRKKLLECSFRVTFPEDFVEKVRMLIDLGLTDKGTVFVKYDEVSIIDTTARIMEQWLPQQPVKDREIVRVEMRGKSNGKGKRMVLDALTTSVQGIPAGTYNTGVPASIIAIMLAQHLIPETGVMPAEQHIPPLLFFNELKKRNIHVFVNGKSL